MPNITVEGLRKTFDGTVAVEDVSLEIDDKKLVTLLGPSGCGKTTTLNMIAGLLTPDEGEIYIDGKQVTDLPPQERNVGMIFQDYALFTHLNVYKNIAFGLRIKKMSKQEIDREIKEIAKLLDLTHLLDRSIRGLSGGESQKVALARTLITRPSALLLDEPLANLDALMRTYMRVELKKLQRDLEQTVVYVCHDQEEAMVMSDKIAIMNEGRIVQYDTPGGTYNNPNNLFVGGFIGSPPMNFIECILKEDARRLFLDAKHFTIDIPRIEKEAKNKLINSELIMGIRPEDIEVSKKKSKEFKNRSSVFALEPLGDKSILEIQINDQRLVCEASKNFTCGFGDEVFFKFNRKKLHIFDKKSTDKISISN